MLAAAVVCGPATLSAQDQGGRPAVFGVAAGLATPAGALADFTRTGYTVAALAESSPRARGVALRGEVAYTALAGDRRAAGAAGAAAVAYPDTRVISGALTLVLLPTDPERARRPRLYFLGGAGLYRFAYGRATAPDALAPPRDETRAGINVGAGLQFPLGPMRAALETRFHSSLGVGATRFFQPVTLVVAF